MNYGVKATAGPGHNPPNPHPIPNILAPRTNFLSIALTLGNSYFSFIRGFFSKWKVIKLRPTAPIITNIREARCDRNEYDPNLY